MDEGIVQEVIARGFAKKRHKSLSENRYGSENGLGGRKHAAGSDIGISGLNFIGRHVDNGLSPDTFRQEDADGLGTTLG
jgi:hypothetical protein